MLGLLIFQNILFWAFVSYQAQAADGHQYWIDPSSCIGRLDDTIDEVIYFGNVAWVRMQPEHQDHNQYQIFATLWKDPPPSSDLEYNVNIVNSMSHEEYGFEWN